MEKKVEQMYCPTEEQTTNILTKQLGKDKFERFKATLKALGSSSDH
jgi:hypothetical protein